MRKSFKSVLNILTISSKSVKIRIERRDQNVKKWNV